jgi:Glycosyl hydrolase family 12
MALLSPLAMIPLGLIPPAEAIGGGGGGGTVIPVCRPLGHLTVKNRQGVASVVRNDNFGGLPECLTVSEMRPNFVVSRQAGLRPHRTVIAFPDIFTGCSWGVCSPRSALPAEVARVRNPVTSWTTAHSAGGRWNAAYDIWFAKRRMVTGQANGAELMIWLSARGLPLASRRVVRIDNAQWYVAHWKPHRNGASWSYIQFRRVHQVAGVANLRLAPFIRLAERFGWIRPSWWMLNIEAGFEIWSGGRGLATRSFSARA